MTLTIADAELLTLPIRGAGAILADPAIQQRVAFDLEKLDEYTQFYADGHDLGRLVVFTDGQAWLLADGFHRLEAGLRVGLDALPCAVYHGTRRDAVLHATSSNLHGVPLTNADKKKRVLTLLADPEWAQWSDREIARHCGVTHPFVGTVRASLVTVTSEESPSPSLVTVTSEESPPLSLHSEISDNGTAPTQRTYTNRYGQQRTLETGAIGQKAPAPQPEVLVLEPEAPAVEETPASTLSESDRACFGPRDEKPAGSIAWCWQTIDLLKHRWVRKELTDQQFAETLQEIKDHEVWNVVPPERPYGSLAALLSAKIGGDFFAEPDFFSQVDETIRSLEGLHTSIANLTPADTGDPEVDMAQVVALCLAFTARCAQVEQALRQAFPAVVAPDGAPADTPDCPPFDPAKFVLGKLCTGGHAWGQTGQTRLRIKGRRCPDCVNEQKRQKRKEQQPAVGADV
jgi:hypothetical protein